MFERDLKSKESNRILRPAASSWVKWEFRACLWILVPHRILCESEEKWPLLFHRKDVSIKLWNLNFSFSLFMHQTVEKHNGRKFEIYDSVYIECIWSGAHISWLCVFFFCFLFGGKNGNYNPTFHYWRLIDKNLTYPSFPFPRASCYPY